MKAKKTYHDKAHRVWKNYINPYQYIEHLRSNNTIYECKYNPIFYSSSYNIANNMTKQIYVKQTKLNVSKPLHRNFLCRKRAHCMPKVSDVMSKLKYLWECSNISVWAVMKEKDLSKWSNGRKEKSFEIQSYLINKKFDNFIITDFNLLIFDLIRDFNLVAKRSCLCSQFTSIVDVYGPCTKLKSIYGFIWSLRGWYAAELRCTFHDVTWSM